MPTRCKPLFAATFSLALLLFACLSPEAQDQTVNQLGEQVQQDAQRAGPEVGCRVAGPGTPVEGSLRARPPRRGR